MRNYLHYRHWISLSLILIVLVSCKSDPDMPKESMKQTEGAPPSNELMLSESQMRLANITLQKAAMRSIGETVSINGRLTVDQMRTDIITARAAGRIEKLFFKETGQTVEHGDSVYTLYSEALLTLQQEYLLAKEQYDSLGKSEKRYKSFLAAAERKLLLYGITREQLSQLTSGKPLLQTVTYRAPTSGVIREIKISEGQYVTEGTLLYETESIDQLWVEAELYKDETMLVREGDRVSVRVTGDENNPIEANVTFLSPEYRANSQVLVMRAVVDNPKLRYKPGQQVQVAFTHSAKKAIALPVDAVIRDGKGTHVYVQSGRNTFRPVMVMTGLENFELVEIRQGINIGDTVVVSGAYLLYSEFILKKGVDPMVAHTH